MAKEILLYSNINEYSSVQFINSINELEAGSDLNLRMNTDGGNPEYGWGMVAKFAEFEGKKTIKVDGKAHSMGLAFLAYADKENIEVLDVAEGVLHRAAYPSWFENSEYFTDALKENLNRVNNSLMTAFKNKIDVSKFEELKGVKFKDVFSMDDRLDVYLTAKDMKAIGLVGKINKITPKKASELVAMGNSSDTVVRLAAEYKDESQEQNENKTNKNKNMTIEEIKADHPEVYNQIFSLGSEAGVAERNDVVKAWLSFNDIDPEAVSNGIESGKELSRASMAELVKKQLKSEALNDIAEESNDDVEAAATTTDKNKNTNEAVALAELDELIKKEN